MPRNGRLASVQSHGPEWEIDDAVDGESQHCAAADLNCDGVVGVADLLILLANWGACTDCDTCPADLTGNCAVGVGDLLVLLANWG